MHPNVTGPALRLVVFGLGKRKFTTSIKDCHGVEVEYYRDIPMILKELKKRQIRVAVTSLTDNKRGSKELLEAFGWDEYITYFEMALPTKLLQFQRLHEISRVKYSEMLFFDDDEGNLEEVATLGVFGIYVPNGMTMDLLEDGIRQFQAGKHNPGETG